MKLLILCYLALALMAVQSVAASQPEPAKTALRVFELRSYTAAPGKMSDLHARFREYSCKLLERHGMTLLGFWSPTDAIGAEETLIYVVAHPSEAAAKSAWDAFRNDPDWIKAKAESEKNGPIVAKVETRFFNPTDYSNIK